MFVSSPDSYRIRVKLRVFLALYRFAERFFSLEILRLSLRMTTKEKQIVISTAAEKSLNLAFCEADNDCEDPSAIARDDQLEKRIVISTGAEKP